MFEMRDDKVAGQKRARKISAIHSEKDFKRGGDHGDKAV
jgi:hypothetical protein